MSIQEGVYTPLVTFYNQDGSIDYETQLAHSKYLVKSGIEGLVVLGSTGENALLTKAEKLKLISTLSQIDTTIIAGVSENNADDAIATIAQFKEAGADIVMLLPSYYYGNATPQQGIIDWYTEVANHSEVPIILYMFPAVSNGLEVSPVTIKTLSKHPKIIGCKCSHGDVHQYSRIALDKEIAANNFKLLSGQGQLFLPLLAINGCGVIDGLSNCFPKTFVKLFKLIKSGNSEAQAVQFIAAQGEVFASDLGFLGLKRAIKLYLNMGKTVIGRVPMNYPVSDEVWGKYESYYNLIRDYEDSI